MNNQINLNKIFIIGIIFFIFSIIILNIMVYTGIIKNNKQIVIDNNLKYLEKSIIDYYCKYKKFPKSLNDIKSDSNFKIPIDKWGNEYILVSLAWREKGSGIDLVGTGKDGKVGGKGDNIDTIYRIDLDKINCSVKIK